MLLQHRGDGCGRREVEAAGVNSKGGGVDGSAEAEEDLRPGLLATIFASFSWEHKSSRPQVEPTRLRR